MREVVPRRIQRITETSVILAAVATIPLIVAEERGVTGIGLALADWLIWLCFAFDLAVGLIVAEDRRKHVRTNLVDTAIVIFSFPTLPAILAVTRFVRLFRALRLFRLTAVAVRVVPALRATLGRYELVFVATLSVFFTLAGGTLLYVLEPATVKGSLVDAVWWAAVTTATIGDADISPVTIPGRIVAVIVMFGGIGLVSTLSASIAAYFVGQGNEPVLKTIEERLDRIEKALNTKRDA